MRFSKKYSLLTVLTFVLFVNSKGQEKFLAANTITNEDTVFVRKEYHLTHTRKGGGGQVYQMWTHNLDTGKYIIKLYKYDKQISLVSYKNGQRDGVDIRCYPDGIIFVRANFVNGQRHGPVKYYDEKGELYAIEEYKNGTLVSTKEVK